MARGLILCVIDALSPRALERAIAEQAVPTLAALLAQADLATECCAPFPSVTPVCAATITTGKGQQQHGVPAMCWFDRAQGRYVEYGSSLRAAQRVGIAQQLTDLIYNLNGSHLSREWPTIFELLDDAGLRTAATTYLVFRGRYSHPPRRQGLSRLAAPLVRRPVEGPRELFYADLFASRTVPCTALLGMPGARDRHASCAAAQLVEEDLCDFLLLSLPDNDWYSHRHGPTGQVTSLAAADRHLARVAEAAGGLPNLLERYAVVVMGDHSQSPVQAGIDLPAAFGQLGVRTPRREGGTVAVCPSQRSAQLYALREGEATAALAKRGLATPGVELACYAPAPGEVAVRRRGTGELRFAPGGDLRDLRGGRWSVDGDLRALALSVEAGRVESNRYPDCLHRLWEAVSCSRSGEVLLSAAPGFEFRDLGGAAHLGGGSHGGLDREDSLTPLLAVGLERRPRQRRLWRLADVFSIVLRHFGIA
jgi:hypothetical protein